MAGLQEYQQPANVVGTISASLSAPVVSDSHVAAAMDFGSLNMGYNGATWDRQRCNMEGSLLASAARTVSATGPTMTNYNARGLMISLNITAASGTGGLKLKILALINGNAFRLNVVPTAITATGIYVYELYPGSTQAGIAGSNDVNQRTPAILPRTWYIDVLAMDGSSYTYSVDYSLIL